jgi:hypothetical protein
MSKHQYQEDCPGCGPVLLDPRIGTTLPNDHPAMKAIANVWGTATREEKQAFHDVCCLNMRADDVMHLCQQLIGRIQVALSALN